MSNIFISHSSKDNAAAQEVASRLSQNNHGSIFLDFDPQKGIPAGTSWERTLYRKLRACQAVIAICTDSYLKSQWCFAEVALARMEGKNIFVLLADPLSPDFSMPSILNTLQYIDLRRGREEGYKRLFRGFLSAGIEVSFHVGTWNPNISPFMGLDAFREKDAAMFFGRKDEIQRGLNLLNSGGRQDWLFILGASGSGKSSLLRAGIVPRLRQFKNKFHVVGPFRPGHINPVEELVLALGEAFQIKSTQFEGVDFEKGGLSQLLRTGVQTSGFREATTLIVIDQFETLLDEQNRNQSNKFLSLLQQITDSPDYPVAILATMRSDFLEALQQHPIFNGIQFDSLSVGQMNKTNLRQIIEEPSRIAAIELEAGLVEAILDDADEKDVLPLISFALKKLYEEYGQAKILKLSDYNNQLKGIGGAIQKTLDDILTSANLTPQGVESLRLTILQMVHLRNAEQAPTSLPVKWIHVPDEIKPLFKRLLKVRLLKPVGEGKNKRVEVTHEALFRTWEQARLWIDENREFLLWRNMLKNDLDRWLKNNKDESNLYRGATLTKAESITIPQKTLLNSDESAFIQASVNLRTRELNRAKRRKNTFVSAMFFAVLALSSLSFLLQRQRQNAQASVYIAQANNSFLQDQFSSAYEALINAEGLHADIDVILGEIEKASRLCINKGNLKYAKIFAEEADRIGISTNRIADLYADMGLKSLQTLNYQESIGFFSNALKKEKENQKSILGLAESALFFVETKQYNKAEEVLDLYRQTGNMIFEKKSISFEQNKDQFSGLGNDLSLFNIFPKKIIDDFKKKYYPNMVRVSGGTFQMGSNYSDRPNDEYPQHLVKLSEFKMSRYETTVFQYNLYCNKMGIEIPEGPKWGWNGNHPMVFVSWSEAASYCQWLGCDLPTEAQWEYAAKGGNNGWEDNYKYSGSNEVDDIGWHSGNSENETQPVGKKKPNQLGIFDMSGNVWEWCLDGTYSFENKLYVNPVGPTDSKKKIIRGGGWDSKDLYLYTTDRNSILPKNWFFNVGFRCACDK